MRVRLLGSSLGDSAHRQYVSSYLVNGTVAIDAGCLGFWGTPQDQEAVRHVFLTHAHADHVASLPVFIENAWTPAEGCPIVYGSGETLDDVQAHIFNNKIWPDFIAISKTMSPFLSLHRVQSEVPVQADGLIVTPVQVNHLVPTFAYVITDHESAVIFAGDSGPTERLWEIAHHTPGLRAVFMEACFPDSMTRLAELSLHMTPEMLRREMAKLPAEIKVIAVHIKVRYRDRVIQQLHDLKLSNLEIGQCETDYNF